MKIEFKFAWIGDIRGEPMFNVTYIIADDIEIDCRIENSYTLSNCFIFVYDLIKKCSKEDGKVIKKFDIVFGLK